MGVESIGKRYFGPFASGACIASLALGTVLIASGAAAQVPTSVDPSKLEKRFEAKPSGAPSVSVQAPVSAPATKLSKEQQEKLAKQKFTLKGVTIEGATVYSADSLKFAYQDQVGKTISMLDAQAIAKKITDHYRKNDYILSQAIVPAQNPSGGMLKIRVIEGFISNVQLQGDIRGDSGRKLTQAFAEHIKGKKPIKISDLERYLLLMDDLPGATAKGVVRPSTNVPGSADLIVTFSHKTYEGSYTLDNRGSDFVGPFQHSATLAANSIFGMYDRTLLRLITTSPTEELRFIDVQHEQQISDEGTRLALTASHSRSIPGDSLKTLNVRSQSQFYQAKLLHPFERSRQTNLVGRFILDARNSSTDVSYILPLSRDRLRSARLGGSYDFADSLFGVNLIDAQVSHGFDVFNATGAGDVPSRSIAENDYTKIDLDITRTQALPGNFSLFTTASGQYAFDPLLPAEQFSIGGATFGQAYDPAELSGDHGVAFKAELRYGQGLNDPLLKSYQVYGFYDIGRTWNRQAGVNGNDKKSLASTGVGVRTNFSDNLSGDFQVAFPMTKDPANQGGRDDEARLFFTVTSRF